MDVKIIILLYSEKEKKYNDKEPKLVVFQWTFRQKGDATEMWRGLKQEQEEEIWEKHRKVDQNTKVDCLEFRHRDRIRETKLTFWGRGPSGYLYR